MKVMLGLEYYNFINQLIETEDGLGQVPPSPGMSKNTSVTDRVKVRNSHRGDVKRLTHQNII